MDKTSKSVILISDFNIEPLAGYLRNDRTMPYIVPTIAPFGQVVPMLIDTDNEIWSKQFDLAIIWTRPESIINSFALLMDFQRIHIDKVLSEVDEFASALAGIKKRVKTIIAPSWVIPDYFYGYGMLDMAHGLGLANVLMHMNLHLSEKTEKIKNVFILNTERWIHTAMGESFNPKLWYMGKIPFGNKVFKQAVKDIKSMLQGIEGNARKIIILDLDDTLWGGIVGDTGWENLRLGGHDPIGEAYIDFQKALKSLTNRGILLGIVSKNEESIALEAIRKHPEMVLKLDDFAGWRINWEDKSQNIVELIYELNLGLQSVVFIDDNPVERARVAETLSEVLVPDWPEDKMLYRKTLLSLDCFNTPSISDEDSTRVKMYLTERKREQLKNNIESLEEWLEKLEIEVYVELLNETNIKRTSQLLNKTNQMNLSTRRMSDIELLYWTQADNRRLWTFRVSDKFGDSGLTGISSIEYVDKVGKVIDFILSCRVMGRNIEKLILHVITSKAKSLGLTRLVAQYLPTLKNKPCYEFWKRSGFEYDNTNEIFTWELKVPYPKPTFIRIIEGKV